jgi:hypothetical protein
MLLHDQSRNSGSVLPYPSLSESDLVRDCLQFLSLRRVFCWRNHTTGIYDPTRGVFRRFSGLKGVSDILGIFEDGSGTFVAVECKVPGRVPTQEQYEFLDRIDAAGGFATWVTSVDELAADLELFLSQRTNFSAPRKR